MSQFVPLTLHIVIADDEEEFRNRIRKVFESELASWGLAREKQFKYEIYECPSVAEFKETAQPHIQRGDLVYATLDLIMPLTKGKGASPDKDAGREMVEWCFQRREETPRAKLEFCVISGSDDALAGALPDSESPTHQKRSKIKRVRKFPDPEARPGLGNADIEALGPDLRGFVRKHMQFCEIPEPGGKKRLIWFGQHEVLDRLLTRADGIANQKLKDNEGKLYLIFSDAGDYEEDWFRLCCHLAGIRPVTCNFKNNPGWDDWNALIANPPPGLLMSHMDRADAQDVHAQMTECNFFENIKKNKSLVFIQFPFYESQIDVGGELAPGAIQILKKCLGQVYGDPKPFELQPSTGFAFREHEQILTFPSYKTLKSAGLIRRLIAYQSEQCQAGADSAKIAIDAEVQDVINEIPWDEHGLQSLRADIKTAYDIAKTKAHPLNAVTIKCFPHNGKVATEFSRALGFRVRGRRLYRILREKETLPTSAAAPLHDPHGGRLALKHLEELQQLYASLADLVSLQLHLEKDKTLGTTDDFWPEHFKPLKEACGFLDSIFKDPKTLQDKIKKFKQHADATNWESHYPALSEKGIAFLSKSFTWPYHELPLHWAVNEFLANHGVFSELHTEPEKVLSRYPELAARLAEINKQRDKVMEEIHKHEEERWEAIKHVQDKHSHPVVVHLDPVEPSKRSHDPMFDRTLECLLVFNTCLAICENQYRFHHEICAKDKVRDALSGATLGVYLKCLRTYLNKLDDNPVRFGQSVFRKWHKKWHLQGQARALPLAAALAKDILESPRYGPGFTDKERPLFEPLLRAANGLQPVDLLEFLVLLRNRFSAHPNVPEFWDQYRANVTELVRRFICATTHEFRFGAVREDERVIYLWSRHGLERVDLDEPAERRGIHVYELDEEKKAKLLPIHDLVRLHPTDRSVWVYSRSNIWKNVTCSKPDDPIDISAGPEYPWLNTDEDLKTKCEVWRWAHE